MKERKHINENELDELLRDLYLEENSVSANENEADFVLNQNYSVKIDAKKEKKLLTKLQKKGGLGGFKFFIPLLFVAIVLLFSIIYFSLKAEQPITSNSKQNYLNDKSGRIQNSENSIAGSNDNSMEEQFIPIKMTDTFGYTKMIGSNSLMDTMPKNVGEKLIPVNKQIENTVPYLLEKDKIRYTKLKNQILQKLIKSDKALYTHVDANELSYANKTIIVNAFTIRNVGITNLEYKTFLADLLIQKRNEDYIVAKVANENWQKAGYPTIAEAYFQNEQYNDFPVVNVSNEGAKMFCKWLEDESALYAQQYHLKIKPLQIRLPYDEEWIYAAREGFAKIAFEKGYNTIYDETAGLVDKAFANRAELVKKRVKRIDTLYTLFTTNRYGWNEKTITDFYSIGFTYFNTVSYSDTIYSERMKIVGKIGRVSEIVYQKKSQRIWLTGLSWKNKEEYLKLENEFKTNLSSPFVGFRPVIINPSDPEYKKPFW